MFADVKGSTELVSRDDPERASERLEHVIHLMREAVHRFGGTVNRVQGDGIMALFGAPIECEDHSVRSCAAALAMLDNVDREAAGPGYRLAIRVGIGSGEVLTLPVMSDAAVHYDAMGSVVHLAARLEQAAFPGSALISLETCQHSQDFFETRRHELTGLRGLPPVLPAFELLCWKSDRSTRRPVRSVLPEAFFGRKDALTTLRLALVGLGNKRGRIVCVTGEAGVGKSRLITEFVSGVHADVRSCATYSSPYKTFAYGPFASLVADLAGIGVNASVEERKNRLSDLTRDIAEFGIRYKSALDALLDVNLDDSIFLNLPPLDRRLRIEAAAIELFVLISRDKPLII